MTTGGPKGNSQGRGPTVDSPTGGAPAPVLPGYSPANHGPLLLVLSAPSGGGKTTLCQHLLRVRPGLARAITCTTRPPRAGERDGVDYHFLQPAVFEKRLQAGEFLEHANVYGRSYGTLKSEVFLRLREHKEVILNVDVQGVMNIRALAQADDELRRALITVFLAPASLQVLAERLRKRGLDSAEEIQKRLSLARQELAQARHFDYLIISSEIEADVRRMQAILEAEQLRQGRAMLPAYD